MNWTRLLAVLLLAVLLQATIGRLVDVPMVDVDLLLVLVLVCGLVAPAHDARMAALLIGFTVDLLSGAPIGINTFAFGCTGLFITKLREVVNRHVWLGRLVIALLAGLVGEIVLALHLCYVQGADLGGFTKGLLAASQIALPAATAAALLTLMPALAPRRRRATWGH
jgi:rod shape-determining protein MreD